MTKIIVCLICLMFCGCSSRGVNLVIDNKTTYAADNIIVVTGGSKISMGHLLPNRLASAGGIGFNMESKQGNVEIQKGKSSILVPYEIKDYIGGFHKGDVNEIVFTINENTISTKYKFTDFIDMDNFVWLNHEIDTGFSKFTSEQIEFLRR